MTDPNVALPAGVYRHYKGPLYLVLGLAHDANADDLADGWGTPLTGREVVVYIGLQLDSAHEGARLAVRTLQDFFARVCPFSRAVEDSMGTRVLYVETCGKTSCDEHPAYELVPRFSYLGPRFADGMQK